MDSESLILFVCFGEIKFENYLHLIFSLFSVFLKQHTVIIIIHAPVVVKLNLIEIRMRTNVLKPCLWQAEA